MKKNVIMFDLNTEKINDVFNIYKQEKIINIKLNIFDLEQLETSCLYLFEETSKSFEIFFLLLKKNKGMMCIVINSKYPEKAELIEQVNYTILQKNITENILYVFEFIQYILKMQTALLFIFLLHELDKHRFLIQNQIYNSFFIELMNSIIHEYGGVKKIFINCISTSNVQMVYQQKIYPYNIDINKHEQLNLLFLCELLLKIKITNKIIKL
ncbi:MAG TPA: hypothetical protein V7792_01260 [Candidatus Azoamicus sp. OHIO2]